MLDTHKIYIIVVSKILKCNYVREESNIRISVLRPSVRNTPPWILKWGGLERSGQRLISFNCKTKIITFFFFSLARKKYNKKINKKKWGGGRGFGLFMNSLDFLIFLKIFSDFYFISLDFFEILRILRFCSFFL